MTYTFDTEVASAYGVHEAIILSNLAFWIAKNKANGENIHDGRAWTYNSVKAFGELFPFFTERQIRSAIDNLRAKGAILTGNYNKSGYDRTLWYAISDDCISRFSQIDLTKKSNSIDQKVQPIPDINTDSKPNINNTYSNQSPSLSPKGEPSPMAKERKPKASQPLDPRIDNIEKAYFEAYESIYHSKPIYTQWGRNRKTLKILLDAGHEQDILRAIRAAKRDKFVLDGGFILASILADGVLGRLARQKPVQDTPIVTPSDIHFDRG